MRRLEDRKDFVAKIIEHAEERQILKYLHSEDPYGRHVVPLEGVFSSKLGPAFVLPIQHSVRELLLNSCSSDYRGWFIRFADELIKGLAFLHRLRVAHLDIKPDNLVYTDALQLQITDFNVAVQVKDEDDVIDYEVSTNGFEAPEMFKRDRDSRKIKPYSPILADRWSCSVNIRDFLGFEEGGDVCQRDELKRFASLIMDEVPEQRPSLLEWSGFKKEKEGEIESSAAQKRPLVDEGNESGKRIKL